MIGKTISHYRIVSQLGIGGMGVVYAADDPRLGRQVALKFVPDDLAHDLHALERLRGEARTASSLNHPNICTIYDIGEYEGRPFIVMELLSGHSLRDCIATRPLKVHEAVDVGIQVADALERAHSRGIIHRDIKPANLFLVDRGPVKVLDFGLAKMLPADFVADESSALTIEHRTAVGVALGTVAYMSPEQVRGDPLDGRTDLFSLGAVLYECVTGQQPFKGKTSAVIFAAILTEAPTAPIALNPDIPLRLQDVINNCLEKDRELRYQDAAGLRAELKRVRRDLESGAARSSPTVAVPASVSRDSGAATRPETVIDRTSGATTVAAPPSSGATRAAPRRSRAATIIGGLVAIGALTAIAFLGTSILRGPKPADRGAVAQAPSDRAAEADRLYQQAVASFQARDYRAAQTGIEAVLALAPSHAGALGLRDDVRTALRRFDAAAREAQRLLDAGDADGATRALESARAIDPGAPEVAQLSARLVDRFRAQAERRSSQDSARQVPRPSPEPPASAPREQAVVIPPPPAPRVSEPPRAAEPPRVAEPPRPIEPPSAPARPVPEAITTPEPPPTPIARADLPPRPAPAPAPAAAPTSQDEDAAIRRVVATYARAIETKDLALFRTVKPNLSSEEQRRLTEGFRAVTSQQVSATITAIEHRGNDAIVQLTRRDTILASGRQQTTTTAQQMTLTQSNGTWVIREIGR